MVLFLILGSSFAAGNAAPDLRSRAGFNLYALACNTGAASAVDGSPGRVGVDVVWS